MNPLFYLILFGVGYGLFSNRKKTILDYNEVVKYQFLVQKYTDKNLVDNGSYILEPIWVMAIIAQESGGDSGAIGDNGKSFGLMQIQYPAYVDANVGYPFNEIKTDPGKNIETGTRYLRFVYNYLLANGVDPTRILKYTIMTYNIGLGNFLSNQKIDDGEKYFNLVKSHLEKLQNVPGV